MNCQLKLDAKAEEVDVLLQQVEELRGGSNSSSAFVENIFQQWEDVRRENEALRGNIESLRAQIQLMKEQARHELQIQAEQMELKHRNDLMENMSSQLQSQSDEREYYEERVMGLKQQVEDYRVENTRLLASRQRAEGEATAVGRQWSALKKEYDLVMGERDSVLRENEALGAKVGRLEEEERSLRNALAQLRARLEEESAGGEMASLRDQLASYEEAVQRLQTELGEERARAHRADQDLLSLRRCNDALRRQREDAAAALVHQLHPDFADLNGNALACPSPSHSRDSAIEADLSEWETEQLEIPLSQEEEEIGVELGGGRDEPLPGSIMPIYVKRVDRGGKLHGKLRKWDVVLEVNEMEVGGMAHGTVADILRHARSAQPTKIKVRRRRLIGSRLVHCQLGPEVRDGRHGLLLQDAVVVAGIKASSPAARLAASLGIGDRILHVNEIPVEGRSAAEVSDLLRNLGTEGRGVRIGLLAPVASPLSSSVSFLSSPSSALPTPTSSSAASCDRETGIPPSLRSTQLPDSALPSSPASCSSPASMRSPTSTMHSSTHSSSSHSDAHTGKSFLDRVQEKMFGKSEKKLTTVKAQASIPNNPSSDTINSGKEAAVLRALDGVLVEESARALPGGTWPKYRHQPDAPKPPKERPSVFPVFAPVRSQDTPLSRRLPPTASPLSVHSLARDANKRPTSAYIPLHSPDSLRLSTLPYKSRHGKAPRPVSGLPQYQVVARKREDVDADEVRGADAQLVREGTEHRAVAKAVPVTGPPPPPPPPYPYHRLGDGVDPDLLSLHSISASSSVSSPRNVPPARAPPAYPPPLHSSTPPRGLHEGEERTLCIEKGPTRGNLGIRITGDGLHGIFVSLVKDGSVAHRYGVAVGDQILEVGGLNLRKAELTNAKQVLAELQNVDSITLKLQYNPSQFRDLPQSCRSGVGGSLSGNSTPRGTPNHMGGTKSRLSRESSIHSASTAHSREILGSVSETDAIEARSLFIHRLPVSPGPPRPPPTLGLRLGGGNALGILVDAVDPRSLAAAAHPSPLRPGDLLLQVNGVDFRNMTLEQGYYELEKLDDQSLHILAEYNPSKLEKWRSKGHGDSLYIRVNIDRAAENTDELTLKCGDILFVDRTVMPNQSGRWRAWKLDQAGRQQSCGIIPSKCKLEEELMLRRSGSEISAGDGASSEGGSSRRGTLR